ncbi:hypothetical protein RB195_021166 [Necator americanus]|uniref:Uncharacterized protein n=1 Tax=Necator americanus TaxID=51031 RepID=A0ABR1E9M9_NECAM
MEKSESKWCFWSEIRFFQLVTFHRPIGRSQWIILTIIKEYMRKIYESEGNGLEVFLNADDLALVESRKDLPIHTRNLSFEPKYKIRPNVNQILEHWNLFWDMRELEEMEDTTEERRAFTLPSYYYELLKEKAAENAEEAQVGAEIVETAARMALESIERAERGEFSSTTSSEL